MYAELKAKASSSSYLLTQEIVQILIGQITSTTQLVAFDSGSSVLINNIAAGWELVATDGLANGTAMDSGWVLRAPIHDNATQFKYVALASTGPTAAVGTLHFTWAVGTGYDAVNKKILGKVTYQDGDGVTGTQVTSGTTTAYSLSATGQSAAVYNITTSDGLCTVNMTASSNHMAFHTISGASATPSDIRLISDYERNDAWNVPSSQCVPFMVVACATSTAGTLANGLANFIAAAASNTGCSVAPIFNDKTAVWGTTGQTANFTLPWGPGQYGLTNAFGGFDTAATAMFTDSAGVRHHALTPMGVGSLTSRFIGGQFSKYCNIFLTTSVIGSTYDTLTASGNTYVIWKGATSGYNFAVLRS